MTRKKTEEETIREWTSLDERVDVVFLSAPVTYPPIPSIALSIFQSELDAAGISSHIVYAMYLAMYLLGTKALRRLQYAVDLLTNGDILFAHLTDVPTACGTEDFLELLPEDTPEERKTEVRDLLKHGKVAAEKIVEACAERILHTGAEVVAASSIYAQQNATLAIFRRIKERNPSVVTLLGGYNVSGPAGLSILRHFPSVDYISFGDGDETIAEFCRNILTKSKVPLPCGIVGRSDPVPESVPYRMTKDMNAVKTPEYRDYFAERELAHRGFFGDIFKDSGLREDTVIFLEGSRGCWWGEKHACTFCGLNGPTCTYREKDTEHFYQEIREAMERYPGARIQLSDNVLSRNMIRKLLPKLAEDPEIGSFTAEVKTNLNSAEVDLLSRAGFFIVQPGIESLSDHLLKLMGKGTSAIQNIALLKYMRSSNVYPIWNMLCAVPGEERSDYEQMFDLIPLIHHLSPPTKTSLIRFSRFSRYEASPKKYGLSLAPSLVYRLCYKGHEDLIRDLGFQLELRGGAFYDIKEQNRDLYYRMSECIDEWLALTNSPNRPVLAMAETVFGLVIFDSRPCASAPRIYLTGLKARIYRLAYEPVTPIELCRALPDDPEEDIREILDFLTERKLMIFLGGRYLALAVKTRSV